jgi:hypothetical protein
MGTKSLIEGGMGIPKNFRAMWQDDPWGARDSLADRLRTLGNSGLDFIDPSESAFFYNKSDKHINGIGKQIEMIAAAIGALEASVEKAKKIKVY